MPDYQESQVTGTAWTRAVRVICENPLGGAGRAATFVEERVLDIGGEKVVRTVGTLIEPLTEANAAEVFPLKNPQTGDVVGSATYVDVYVMLHSLYLHVANKRDASQE